MKINQLPLLFLLLPNFFVAQETPTSMPKLMFPASQGTTRAVIIGISDYREPLIPDLRFADKDAQALANYLLSEAGGSMNKEQVQLLINQQATAGNIISALTWLVTDSKPGDRVILSFSGHGDVEQLTKSQWGYLLTHDAPSKVYPAGGTVPLPYLQDIIATLSEAGVHVFIISDACHAGKLAGSARGGAKATTAALAQQFANEVKLLSCQPEEYSLEGEQWGGGRGCFSFHLLNGLAGLADGNQDGTVSLMEAGRYLEDKVTTDAAPQSQVPLSIGNRSTVLAKVHQPSLAQLQLSKQNPPLFSGGSLKGMEAAMLSGSDTSLQALYHRFEMALESGNLLDGSGNSANDLYLRLIREPALAKLHGAMTRNLAAALQNEAQVVINQLLFADPQIVDDAFTYIARYDHLPAWLARAAELLGEKHYMFPYLKAREYFFRSKTFRPANYPHLSTDSLVYHQTACIDTALTFDPEASYLFLEKGCLLYRASESNVETYIPLFKRAAELSPEWVLPVFFLGRAYDSVFKYDEAVEMYTKALVLDSTFLPIYASLGWVPTQEPRRWQEEYVRRMQDFERQNPGKMPITYLNYLGNSLWLLGRYEEAKTTLLKGVELSNGTFAQLFNNLNALYCDLGEFEEAEKCALKIIELKPLSETGYWYLANTRLYLMKNKLQTIPSIYRKASLGSSTQHQYENDLIYCYMQLGRLDSALLIAQAWLQQDSTIPQALLRIGQLQLKLGNETAAQTAFQKLVGTKQFWGYFYPSYYNLIGQIHTMPWEQVQITLKRYSGSKNPLFPFWIACALAACNKQEEALLWLESALKIGWKSDPAAWIDPTLYNPDLDSIRNTTKFKALVKEYLPERAKYMKLD